MATDYPTKSYQTPPQQRGMGLHSLRWRGAIGSWGTVQNDRLLIGHIPRGGALSGVAVVELDALDSHATPTGDVALEVGNGTTTYRIIASFAAETPAVKTWDGVVDAVAKKLTGSAEWKVWLLAVNAFATVAATAQVGVVVLYDMDTAGLEGGTF